MRTIKPKKGYFSSKVATANLFVLLVARSSSFGPMNGGKGTITESLLMEYELSKFFRQGTIQFVQEGTVRSAAKNSFGSVIEPLVPFQTNFSKIRKIYATLRKNS